MYVVKFIGTEVERGLTGAGGGRKGKFVFNAYRVSVWDNEKVLELDRGMVAQQCECT